MAIGTQKRGVLPVLLAVVFGVVLIFMVMLATGVGTPVEPPTPVAGLPPTARPELPRAKPDEVFQRTLIAVEGDDATALYNELAPGLAATFELDDLRAAIGESRQALGSVVSVRMVSPLTVKTEAPWSGEWADMEVEIEREMGTSRHLVRFHRERGEWWLFGTLELE